MNQGGYLLLSAIAFFLTGVGLYAIDKKVTVAARRWAHRWTSPESEPFPESKRKGIVYGQKSRRRFVVAGSISLAQTLLSLRSLDLNPFYELMTLLLEAPIMVLGTYAGDRIVRLFGRAQPVFEAIDRIEAGETSAGEEARELFREVSDRVGRSEDERATAATAGDGPPPPDEAGAPGPEGAGSDGPSEDPRELMRKYTGGH